MKNGKKIAVLLLTSSGLFPGVSQAADTIIEITGRVIASPCVVNGGQEKLSVDLGSDIQADTLSAAGAASPWKPFTLSLNNCPKSTTSFSVAFSGTADDNADYYKNTGSAANLALELTTQDETNLKNGTTLQNLIIDTASHSYDLNLRAHAVSKGDVTPGTIQAQVQATFTYQ
ncbi:type 1 fimbrial protein [Salmonella enterica]